MPIPVNKPAEHAKWYAIRARAAGAPVAADTPVASAAEILIYGDIGESWYEETVAAKDFVREIAALEVDQITIRINSLGGSVVDGIAIFNALRRHKANITTVIDGVAASVASLIAMAGDSIEMANNALMMIHAPWGYAAGNSVALRESADMLDSYADAMASSYAVRSNDKPAALALLTDGKDHWFTAEEALAAQLIDVIVADLPLAASAHMSGFVKARYESYPQPVLPAASAAPTRPTNPKESTNMPTPTEATQEPAAVQAAADAAVKAALEADKQRRAGISAAFAKFTSVPGMAEIHAACVDDQACTVDLANSKILAHLAKDAQPVATARIITVEDSRDKFRAGVMASVMARASLEKDDRANNYRGFSLMDIARECLAHAGANVRGMDKMQLVAAAFTHTGSDFPLLLANVAEKAMLKGYDEAEETFQLWTSKGTLGDFKPGSRVDLNTFPSLLKVADGAEYKNAKVGERGETVQLATYGRLFSLTRHTIINDDLDSFTKIPKAMGRAAIRTIGDLVYAVLTSNPAMADGTALFHADHKNLMAGSVISTGSVDAMGTSMALQKDATGSTLNINMAKLIVPRSLRGAANTVRDSEFEVGAASKNNTVPNSVRGTFEVIADARLDAASTAAWYGVASQDVHDTVEVSYLDGVDTPTLENQNGWHVDGVEFKVRMDAGVKPLDFRTMQKNPGA
ncbi:ATP-dependent protease ClpP protease subunit [Duganella sp. 1224]|uniref:ClpP-like prohead protease/major capsid protein fusion protein n=1 Tax=Duganella sp. 1224 TaxID=2587052 RepID=UPI0015CEA2D8|nr:ClpP-like prohead protease/major capsid protein fusion protein [Duganella sp. 1224]NYE62194.1 ATP-dependent protease ClpP protease subunit [Duganella sp. 1224]